jgi:protein subunit release factor A
MEIKGLRKKLFSVTIKDCRVDTFTVGGHGGAGKDTSNTGVRVTHSESGAVGKATESRSQRANKTVAFRRMAESKTFRQWAKHKAAKLQASKSVDELVDEAMIAENLKIEYRTEQGWEEVCLGCNKPTAKRDCGCPAGTGWRRI